jgi:hypothetical protein
MDPREFNHGDRARRTATPASDGVFRLELCISVRDARSLWAAAAAKALAVGLMSMEDVEDTLGPVEDPSIADCLALLAEPGPLPGCKLTHFAVVPTDRPHDLDVAA